MPFTCRNHACITGVFPYTCDSHVYIMRITHFAKFLIQAPCLLYAEITHVSQVFFLTHVKRMITCVYHAYHIRFSHMCHMRGMKRLFHMRATHM